MPRRAKKGRKSGALSGLSYAELTGGSHGVATSVEKAARATPKVVTGAVSRAAQREMGVALRAANVFDQRTKQEHDLAVGGMDVVLSDVLKSWMSWKATLAPGMERSVRDTFLRDVLTALRKLLVAVDEYATDDQLAAMSAKPLTTFMASGFKGSPRDYAPRPRDFLRALRAVTRRVQAALPQQSAAAAASTAAASPLELAVKGAMKVMQGLEVTMRVMDMQVKRHIAAAQRAQRIAAKTDRRAKFEERRRKREAAAAKREAKAAEKAAKEKAAREAQLRAQVARFHEEQRVQALERKAAEAAKREAASLATKRVKAQLAAARSVGAGAGAGAGAGGSRRTRKGRRRQGA